MGIAHRRYWMNVSINPSVTYESMLVQDAHREDIPLGSDKEDERIAQMIRDRIRRMKSARVLFAHSISTTGHSLYHLTSPPQQPKLKRTTQISTLSRGSNSILDQTRIPLEIKHVQQLKLKHFLPMNNPHPHPQTPPSAPASPPSPAPAQANAPTQSHFSFDPLH